MTPQGVTSVRRRLGRVPIVLLLLFSTLLAACSEAEVRWRDVTLELPDGWVVNELDRSRLSIANARFPDPDVGNEPTDLGSELEAAVFFTHEPNATAAAWRALVVEQEGSLDEDVRLSIDGAPATRLIFTYDANGTPTREMILLVPARELVGLFQPITPRFSQEGPSRFDHYRPTFDAIVDSLNFGAPLREAG
ncbi:MAG: hypothetical protein M3252_01005 [Actinomycetota bacterium]|nr:hypothetical protein [Actinomycetota bacterium]